MGSRQSDNLLARHVFCYGSLRPDDDSGMPWTLDAVRGMRGQRAIVPGARLYKDQYASLVFKNDDKSSNEGVSGAGVAGWVLTVDDPALFDEKVKVFDQIEGYKPDGSGLYQRAVVEAILDDTNGAIGESIGAKGTAVKAFVYLRPDCSKEELIPSGDWLQREEN